MEVDRRARGLLAASVWSTGHMVLRGRLRGRRSHLATLARSEGRPGLPSWHGDKTLPHEILTYSRWQGRMPADHESCGA